MNYSHEKDVTCLLMSVGQKKNLSSPGHEE